MTSSISENLRRALIPYDRFSIRTHFSPARARSRVAGVT